MNRRFFSAIAVSVSIASGAAIAGQPIFPNSQSAYGTLAPDMHPSKIVNISTASTVNVDCGEVVTFRNGDKSFTWKFDVLSHKVVDLKVVAPAGFSDKKILVYVAKNNDERN